jgi:hypothetical protein
MLSRFWRLEKLVLQAVPVLAFLSWIPGGALAQDADPNLCIPAIGGLAPAPTIDGRVDGDPGWNRAMRVNLKKSGGAPRVGVMQIGRIGNNLYISLEVEGTPVPNYNDLVVLGFSTTTNPMHDWRVQIHPFTTDDVGAARSEYVNDDPRTRDYWRNSTTPTTGANANIPAWNLTSAVPSTPFIGDIKVSRSNNNWALEMRIPTTGVLTEAGGSTALYLPSSPNTLKFYANVLSTFDLTAPLSPSFAQDPWPQAVPMLVSGAVGSGGDFASNRTPATSTWATVSTFDRAECGGVYLASGETPVGVRQSATAPLGYTSLTGPQPFRAGGSPTGAILTTVEECQMLGDNVAWPGSPTLPTNFFIAKPGNDGAVPAPGVSVKFYVAPWGIPGAFDPAAPNAYWHPLGELYRPSSMTTTVHSTPATTIPVDVMEAPALPGFLSTPSWQLSYKQACVYTKSAYYGNVGHHCIQAEVQSTDPSVRIRNKSIQINHNFVTASVAEQLANISVRGRGRSADKGRPHEVILFSHKLVQTFKRDGEKFFPGAIKPEPMVAGRTSAAASERVPTTVPSQFRALGPVPAERFPKGIDEGMTVITNAYLPRSDSMIIGNTRYRRAEYIGGYSYFAGHAGVAKSWSESIALPAGAKTTLGQSAALRSVDPKIFEGKTPSSLPISARVLQIAEDDTVAVAVTVEAQEEGTKPGETTPGTKTPCGCLDFGCRAQKADAGGGAVTIAGLFLVGGIGIGGFTFMRRRKGKPEKPDENDRRS